MRLVLRETIPSFRVVHAGAVGVLGSRASRLARWSEGSGVEFLARRPYFAASDALARARPLERLLRSGFHDAVVLPDGVIVGIIRHQIVRVRPGESIWQEVFRVPRGTRPLGLALTEDGCLYFGEYFGNSDREPVRIYRSWDKGGHWDVAHCFARGAVRHVHRIVSDEWRKGLWILTGDDGDECRILFTPDHFKTLETVIAGNQQARAASAIPCPAGLVFATDTPKEQNHIYLLSNGGRSEILGRVPGSSFFAGRAADSYFISTGVEPSRVNRGRCATLWGSATGLEWHELVRLRKDSWPYKIFGYGNIVLPSGAGKAPFVFASATGVVGCDGATFVWTLDQVSGQANPIAGTADGDPKPSK